MSEKLTITIAEASWSGQASRWMAAHTSMSLKEAVRVIANAGTLFVTPLTIRFQINTGCRVRRYHSIQKQLFQLSSFNQWRNSPCGPRSTGPNSVYVTLGLEVHTSRKMKEIVLIAVLVVCTVSAVTNNGVSKQKKQSLKTPQNLGSPFILHQKQKSKSKRQLPEIPGMPELPGMPQIPGMPELPGMPQIPECPNFQVCHKFQECQKYQECHRYRVFQGHLQPRTM
ncbi:hypothetical protein TNCV_3172071 [Trichonephila clavipes]|nr:hypothetical protein TNCV_3172071 [Trichonephila clavipes]